MRSFPLALLFALPLTASAQLSGIYTIGGANPDYATVADAVGDLMGQGAQGNVTFSIRPGTYTGRYVISQIPGSPGSLVVRSETGNAADVVLQHNATSAADNFIFSISQTQGVFFQDLTFRPLGTDHARAIHFFNDADLFQVIDCVFEGIHLPGVPVNDRVFIQCDQANIGNTDNPDDVFIEGCTFRNGSGAVDLQFNGLGGARSNGLYVVDNVLVDQSAFGIAVTAAVGSIEDNMISTSVGDSYVGIRTAYVLGGSQFRRNDIRAYSAGSCTGMEITNTQLTNGNFIANNMIYVNGATETKGLLVNNLWGTQVVHNSVLVAAGDPSATVAFHELGSLADGQDTEVRNNIFSNAAGGSAYRVDLVANVAKEDHNCLHTTGSTLSEMAGVLYATLGDHQAGTGLGSDDIDLDPLFPVQPDLHMNHCQLDGLGEYLFFLASDIDGDPRNNPSCDMGADEYAFTSGTIATQLVLTADQVPYTLTAPLGSSYAWNDGSSGQTLEVTASGSYACSLIDAFGCSYAVQWDVDVDLTTAVAEVGSTVVLAYPNPATSEVWLAQRATRAMLIDPAGRIVATWAAASHLTGLDDLPPGMHLLVLEHADGTVIRQCLVLQ